MKDSEFAEELMAVRHKLVNLALRRLRNRWDAEEVVDSVIERLWRYRHSFRGDSSVWTWAYRAVSNYLLDVKRWSTRHPGISDIPMHFLDWRLADNDKEVLDRVGDYPVMNHTSPDMEYDSMEEFATRLSRLGTLSAEQKEVFYWRDLKNMTYEEISILLEIPMNTVRTRLLRARRRLSGQHKPRPRAKVEL